MEITDYTKENCEHFCPICWGDLYEPPGHAGAHQVECSDCGMRSPWFDSDFRASGNCDDFSYEEWWQTLDTQVDTVIL